jgi:dinuclear metal center YbgI/SA1388 family protein
MTTRLADLSSYLDQYLRISEVPDEPNALNGLQVENSGRVERLAAAVDACQATIDAAAARGANLLIVHHGLFWGGLQPIAGRQACRLRRLFEGDVALYAAHIPLDCHPDVGNNVVLARLLGIAVAGSFGDYRGTPIGVWGTLEADRATLVERVRTALGVAPMLIPGGPDRIRRVGVITGAGGNLIGAARDAGLDTYVTGEGAHHTYFDAEEWGLNVLYAGHYATETVGIKALAAHLAARFRLPWDFLDHPTGL